MSFRITIPFYAFRLNFTPGLNFLNPLRDKTTLRTGMSLPELSKEYQDAIQKNILNKGNATKLLDEWSTEEFVQDELNIPFPASKDGFTYPDFELTFDTFYQELATGYWGIIPTLGLEAFASDYPALKEHLKETVKIEFARKNYLNSVQNIISTIWFNQAELLRQDFPVDVADPGEDLINNGQENSSKLLQKVGKPLQIEKVQVYGRDQELERIVQVLKGNFGKNILVVGPSGVGKTALIWDLSRMLKSQNIPGTIWETTASNMIKELSGENGWEFNIGELCREFQNKPNDFLFIRNLMDLFEVGKYVGNSVSMADYLLPFISRGELRVITECTGEELARIELQSPTYKSNFQIISLEEPRQDINQIILKKINDIAQDTQVKITKEAIKEVVRLTRRFTPYAGMPGRPIRFLESMLLNRAQAKNKEKLVIDRKTVIEHFCGETGMPQFMVDPGLVLDPLQIKQSFNNSVFGQELAVNSLVDILATVKADLNRSGKPIASFLFVGPTGVGKTELAKVLAGFMFGRRDRMLRFDMSEYSNPYSVMRLIGQHNSTEGLLTAAVRRAPFSVILFDEIEKADSTFYDLLLQVLSEGRLTDNRGNLANFCSTIIIMTSNIGASNRTFNPIGLGQRSNGNDLSSLFESAVQKHFRPELYNRIDKVIPFKPLDKDTVRFVVDREIQLFRNLEGIKFRKLDLEIAPEVFDFLAEKGYNSKYGARFLQRKIREELLVPLAKRLNEVDYDDQLLLQLGVKDQSLTITTHSDPLALELLIEELNKIQNADYASFCRRNAIQFMEAYHYTMLLQELDKLEDLKKQQKNDFWKDARKADRIAAIMNLKNRMELLLNEINNIENQLSLMALGIEQYVPVLVDELEVWEQNLFQLKTDIYSLLFPKSDACYFALFGRQPEELLYLYLKIFENLGLEYQLTSVWLKNTKQKDAPKTVLKGQPFDVKTFLEKRTIPAIGPNCEFLGVQGKLNSQLVKLYFTQESGVQKWLFPSFKESQLFDITFDEQAIEVPSNIHRKEFLKRSTVNRSFNGRQLKDSNLGVNREMNHTQLVDFLSEIFKDHFKGQVLLEMGS